MAGEGGQGNIPTPATDYGAQYYGQAAGGQQAGTPGGQYPQYGAQSQQYNPPAADPAAQNPTNYSYNAGTNYGQQSGYYNYYNPQAQPQSLTASTTQPPQVTQSLAGSVSGFAPPSTTQYPYQPPYGYQPTPANPGMYGSQYGGYQQSYYPQNAYQPYPYPPAPAPQQPSPPQPATYPPPQTQPAQPVTDPAPPPPEQSTITVKPFVGRACVIDFNPQELVSEVKRRCGQSFNEGTDITQFTLSFGDKYLEDRYSLEHYGVSAGDTLDFITRAQGGHF